MVSAILRIAILGAESTGKSTLAARLAAVFAAPPGHEAERAALWVPEYLREFVDVQGRVPREEDQTGIARTQLERERALAVEAQARGQRVLFCDTAPLMTAVYSRVYWGRVPPGLLALEAAHDYALTLVAAPDVPWVPDGLQRESEAVRARVHACLLDVLGERGIAYTLLTGELEERVGRVVGVIEGDVRLQRR